MTQIDLTGVDVNQMLQQRLGGDSALVSLLGRTPDDPRVYPYYNGDAIINASQRAYVTYAKTSFPERVTATGDPIWNLTLWAINWTVAAAVRDRLVALFDEQFVTTPAGVPLWGTKVNEHDNYQEDTKFASIVVQFRFGFSRV